MVTEIREGRAPGRKAKRKSKYRFADLTPGKHFLIEKRHANEGSIRACASAYRAKTGILVEVHLLENGDIAVERPR